MLSEASAALSGIKVALDLVKGVQAFKTETDLNQAVIGIQRALLEAQANALDDYAKQMRYVGKISELEDRISRSDLWATERARYLLTEFPTGNLAYVCKEDALHGEPPHRLCAKCFNDNKKSILQTKNKHSGGETVHCQNCDQTLTLHSFPPIEYRSVGRRGHWMD